MKIEVLVCTLNGNQRMEYRDVPEEWFLSTEKELNSETGTDGK
jgi:hypothetical protein